MTTRWMHGTGAAGRYPREGIPETCRTALLGSHDHLSRLHSGLGAGPTLSVLLHPGTLYTFAEKKGTLYTL